MQIAKVSSILKLSVLVLSLIKQTGHAQSVNHQDYVSKKCGVNGLYVLLSIEGSEVDYARIESAVPVSENGTSLLELKKAASELFRPHEVCKLNIEDLKNSASPFLALMNPIGEQKIGHFLVVTGYDLETDRFCTIDGQTGRTFRFPADRFSNQWTGYCLIPSSMTETDLMKWFCFLAIASLLLFWGFEWRLGSTEQ